MQWHQIVRIKFRSELSKGTETLKKLNVDPKIIDTLAFRESAIVQLLVRAQSLTGDIVAIPVIPLQFIPLREQLRMLRIKKIVGCTASDLSSGIKNIIDILPHQPYFMIDISSGQGTKGMSLHEFQSEASQLTIPECFALMLHAPKLVQNGIWAGGVRMADDPEMGVYLKPLGNNMLRIEWKEIDQGVDDVCIPTCMSRK